MGGHPDPGIATGAAPEAGAAGVEPANIRLLRRLVTGLALVMVLGMLAIVGLMLARLMQTPALPLPETVKLPEGAQASAVTVTERRFIVVTVSGELLVYDRDSGKLVQRLLLE